MYYVNIHQVSHHYGIDIFLNEKYKITYDKSNIDERFYQTMIRHKKITLKTFQEEKK